MSTRRRNGRLLLTLTVAIFVTIAGAGDVKRVGFSDRVDEKRIIGDTRIIVDNDVRRILEGRRSAEVILPSAGAAAKNLYKTSSIVLKVTETDRRESVESTAATTSTENPKNVQKEFGAGEKGTDDGLGGSALSAVTNNVKNSSRTERTDKNNADAGENSSTFLVLRLAHCQASCLSKRNSKLATKVVPFKSIVVPREDIQNAWKECWDTCHLLEAPNGLKNSSGEDERVQRICMAKESTCSSGCREACEFHRTFEANVAKNGTRAWSALAGAKVESSLSYSIFPVNVRRTKSKPTNNKRLFQLDLAWPSPNTEGETTKGEEEDDEPVVYSVVQHVPGKTVHLTWTWQLLEQTIKRNISLTFSQRPKRGDIRVLATTPTRLVRVFSVGRKTDSSVQNEISDDDGGGGDAVKGLISRPEHVDGITSAAGEQRPAEHAARDSWHLRKVSMIHQKFLVITEISWDSPAAAVVMPVQRVLDEGTADSSSGSRNIVGLRENISAPINSQDSPEAPESFRGSSGESAKSKQQFLLTWQENGGILKGNMVTDTNAVTVSLLPNTVYLIQVGRIQGDPGQQQPKNPWDYQDEPKVDVWSPFLTVNTSEATSVTSSRSSPHGTRDDFEESPEAGGGKSNSKSHQNAQESQRKTATISERIESIFKGDLQQYHHASLISSGRAEEGEEQDDEDENEPGKSERPLRPGLTPSVVHSDHDHVRDRTLFGLTCECSPESRTTKWCCQTLIVSFVVILGAIYGLLLLMSCLLYIFYIKLNCPTRSYCHSRLFTKDFFVSFFLLFSRSNIMKLNLVEHEESSTNPSSSSTHDDSNWKDTEVLSHYNIV